MLLNNQETSEEIKEEIKKNLEKNDNENTMTQNLWNVAKAVLRGKFTAIQSYLKKQEKSQINNLTLHLKQLEKEEQKKPKVSRNVKHLPWLPSQGFAGGILVTPHRLSLETKCGDNIFQEKENHPRPDR